MNIILGTKSKNLKRTWVIKYNFVFYLIAVLMWSMLGIMFMFPKAIHWAPYITLMLAFTQFLSKYHFMYWKQRLDKNRNVNELLQAV